MIFVSVALKKCQKNHFRQMFGRNGSLIAVNNRYSGMVLKARVGEFVSLSPRKRTRIENCDL